MKTLEKSALFNNTKSPSTVGVCLGLRAWGEPQDANDRLRGSGRVHCLGFSVGVFVFSNPALHDPQQSGEIYCSVTPRFHVGLRTSSMDIQGFTGLWGLSGFDNFQGPKMPLILSHLGPRTL